MCGCAWRPDVIWVWGPWTRTALDRGGKNQEWALMQPKIESFFWLQFLSLCPVHWIKTWKQLGWVWRAGVSLLGWSSEDLSNTTQVWPDLLEELLSHLCAGLGIITALWQKACQQSNISNVEISEDCSGGYTNDLAAVKRQLCSLKFPLQLSAIVSPSSPVPHAGSSAQLSGSCCLTISPNLSSSHHGGQLSCSSAFPSGVLTCRTTFLAWVLSWLMGCMCAAHGVVGITK